mmetsp:Transcript_21960/g.46687  ORF Transcript_21960/g.46687 Transcript_21960/m.46687 type:complete len:138 (+) Transcript_21960:83-496(+)
MCSMCTSPDAMSGDAGTGDCAAEGAAHSESSAVSTSTALAGVRTSDAATSASSVNDSGGSGSRTPGYLQAFQGRRHAFEALATRREHLALDELARPEDESITPDVEACARWSAVIGRFRVSCAALEVQADSSAAASS